MPMVELIPPNSPQAPTSGSPRSLAVIAALAAAAALGVLLFGPLDTSAGTTTVPASVPPLSYQDPAVATVEGFVAAFNAFDRAALIGGLDSLPTVLQWPHSLGAYYEHLGAYHEESLRDTDWFEFQRGLQSHITLTDCESRAPSGAGTELYDVLVDCNFALTDQLLSAAGADAIAGRLIVGIVDDRIKAVFSEQKFSTVFDTPDLFFWMGEYQPHLFAHWMGGVTGSPPLYGTELAEVLVDAASARRKQDEEPPAAQQTDRAHPAPTGGHSMTVVPDDGRVYLLPGRVSPFFNPFFAPQAPPIWELTPEGTWRTLPGPELTYLVATLTYADALDKLVMVAVVGDPDSETLLTLALQSSGDWEELDRRPLSDTALFWWPETALSSAYNDTSDQIAVIGDGVGWGWRPALGLYDVSSQEWTEDADPWVGHYRSPEESRPCQDPTFAHDLSVAFDPVSGRFIIAAGSELCAYNPDGATIELIVNDYGPQDTRAIVHDPVGGLLYIIGDGHLWSEDPDTGSTQDVGPLPPDLLWRNVDMAAQPHKSRILVFDGASLWSYHPTNDAWSNLDRTD